MTTFAIGISPDSVKGSGVDIVFAVVVGIIIVAAIATAVRRRRYRHELEGAGVPAGRGRWWRGPYAPPDEPLHYQRRDDSGQG
jgi:hypothetical protein